MKIAIYSHSKERERGWEGERGESQPSLKQLEQIHTHTHWCTHPNTAQRWKKMLSKICSKELEFADQIWRNVENVCIPSVKMACWCANAKPNFSSFISIFHFPLFLAAWKSLHSTCAQPNCSIFHTGNSSQIFKFSNLFNKYSVSNSFIFSTGWFVLFFDFDDDGAVVCVRACAALWPRVLVYWCTQRV